jgi:eukaryotic-like serine/threonine-protein kinase
VERADRPARTSMWWAFEPAQRIRPERDATFGGGCPATVTRMAVSGVADLVGRVLAGRYRLLAPIGTGASGRVYVADDVRLRRKVAVKVLHSALAEDAGFLRRFRTEAQLAASLHHPNIMAVYDWGDDIVPFMVLELLEGGSLRGMLDHEVRLSPAQAAHVGRQVAAALEYAHSRGLVHRDVKPANLLFDEHGIVRVADFGLARALAEASWTEPAGAVLGTARYAAPEQGGAFPLDGRADLYALALVIIESVTGRVPLVADTPLGTLAARSRGGVVAPVELGPLSAVVERAGRSDPSDRYPNAATMEAALVDAEDALPPAAPLQLAGLGSVIEDLHPTALPKSGQRAFDQDAAGDDDIEIVDEPELIDVERERRPIPWAGIVVAVVATVALLAAAFALARAPGGSTAVPNVVGVSAADAEAAMQRVGLGIETRFRRDRAPKDTVIEQLTRPGVWQPDGDPVVVVVSRGPKAVGFANVVGQPVDAATTALQALGFVVDTGTHAFDEQAQAGTVLASEPTGEAPPDSVIKLTVSDGPAPRTVPDVGAGGTFAAAAAALDGVQLTATQVDEFNDTVPAGQVLGTTPAAGTQVPRGTAVSVRVSKGPDLVAVPAIAGLTIEAASQTLAAQGFQAFVQGNLRPGGKVLATDPAAGTMVKRGSTVRVLL